MRAGDAAADPGAELIVHGNATRLRDAAAALLQRAQVRTLEADAAALAISDHKPVETLDRTVAEADRAARQKAADADSALTEATRAALAARDSAGLLRDALMQWTRAHPDLTRPHESSPDEESTKDTQSVWSIADIEELSQVEPAQVLAASDTYAYYAVARAEALAGELRARAQQIRAAAAQCRIDAALLNSEAALLREGRLLPLPRPDWAGPGDDSVALGAVLDWSPGFDDPHDRALLEAAMAAAGLLGASLTNAGTDTRYWRVEAETPVVERNLAEVVTVDSAHPLATVALAVLSRVGLANSAKAGSAPEDPPLGLLLGRDGSFRAGVLHGCVPGSDDPAQLTPAGHIGARQRRALALARADVLERQARELEEKAVAQERDAARFENDAAVVSESGRAFPSREKLRAAESRRAETARIARDAQDVANTARLEAERLARELQTARAEWLERTRGRGLPGDIEQLARMQVEGSRAAQTLRGVTEALSEKLAGRLERALAGYSPQAISQKLTQVEVEATVAFRAAADSRTALRVLEETAGAAIADVLARHDAAKARLNTLKEQLKPANDKKIDAVKAEVEAQAHLDGAKEQLREAEPKAEQLLHALRALLSVPGVADAVLDGDQIENDAKLLDQVEVKLRGRKTMTKKTVRERADAARTQLAGIWSLDPGDDYGELLTYVLTHRDAVYTPTAAAAHAQMLRTRAQQALAASEERALREFVIGRLPSAIRTAWTRLHDWKLEVNRKMQSAAASSGVGVQVRIPSREDLPPATRKVYELSCKLSDVERTPDQQRQLGEALQALLDAAEGETMQQRVATAVDIRDWVDVQYEVTRPGGKTQRWSSKTGLSGGERRLVVLAPMLAAIAAGYDRFGEKALRLVTLDEVPAEVDDRGREGLARYLAQLDLDLICTSHLWDGCPGAWDGIDAYDLEAGPDGTVVAFPMLVRGLFPIPELAVSEISELGEASPEGEG